MYVRFDSKPLGAVGLLELELALASPVVDVLLGGAGRPWPARELTDIEDAILNSVVQMMVQELNLAWQSVGLEFVFEKRESEAAVARMLTAGEKTLCVSFEARMPEAQGAMNICLPAVVLNAILRRLISEGDRPKRRSKEAQVRMRELMGEAKLGAVLQFPTLRLRASEVSDPKTGIRIVSSTCEAFGIGVAGRWVAIWAGVSGASGGAPRSTTLKAAMTSTRAVLCVTVIQSIRKALTKKEQSKWRRL